MPSAESPLDHDCSCVYVDPKHFDCVCCVCGTIGTVSSHDEYRALWDEHRKKYAPKYRLR